jgi:hypothetical protein
MEFCVWELPTLHYSAAPSPEFFGRAVSQILFLIAIYLSDLYPLLRRRGPRLAAYLVLLPMGFSVPPSLLTTR